MNKSALLHKERTVIRRRTLQAAFGLLLILGLAYGYYGVSWATLLLLAISFGLVVLPVWAELQIKLHTFLEARHEDPADSDPDCSFQSHIFLHNTTKALRTVLTAAYALGLLTFISGVSLIGFNVGPAIAPVQIALLSLVLVPAITATLLWDKPDSRRVRQAWRDRLTGRPATFDFVGFGLLTALLGYGNFLYFFTRNDISAAYMAMDTPLFLQATTVAWVTVLVCLIIQLYFERINTHEAVLSDYLTQNKPLLHGTGLVFVAVALCMYTPWLATLTRSAPLDVVDWLLIILTGTAFTAVRLVQRHTRKHTRHLVVALHREIHG